MVKLKEIVGSVDGLKQLISTKLPISIAYNISKLIPQLDSETKFYEDKRQELVKQYGTETEVKGNFQVSPENLSKFVEELNEIGDLDIDLKFDKIKVSDLGNIEIEPKHLVAWLFE